MLYETKIMYLIICKICYCFELMFYIEKMNADGNE